MNHGPQKPTFHRDCLAPESKGQGHFQCENSNFMIVWCKYVISNHLLVIALSLAGHLFFCLTLSQKHQLSDTQTQTLLLISIKLKPHRFMRSQFP